MASARWSSPTGCSLLTSWPSESAESSTVRITNIYPFPKMLPDRALGMEPPEPMDGQDLSALLKGEEPEEQGHFTLGYHDYVWSRDDRYTMFSRNDGTEAKL